MINCPNCGRKIGKGDRLRLSLMAKAMATNPRAQSEFSEVYGKGWCSKCIANFFKPKFREAVKELKGTVLPERERKVIERAEKMSIVI